MEEMRSFKWTAGFAVWVPELDQEHKDIIRLGSELQRAVSAGIGSPRVESLLQDLLEHVSTHFAHEEGLMEQAAYPSRDWHVRQHQAALKKAAVLVKAIRAGQADAALQTLDEIFVWLRDHTCVADKMMGSYLRNRRRLAMAS